MPPTAKPSNPVRLSQFALDNDMPEPLEPRRVYSDRQISRIIKRAAELQDQIGRGDSAGRGISIAEIEQIGRELGIDPACLHQAVAEMGGGAEPGALSIWGPTLIEARRCVNSEATEREWEMMVQEVRRMLGFTGETGKLGQALEWKTSDKELVTYQVTVSPREGQTEIQIVSRRDGAQFLTYFIAGLIGLFAALGVAAPSFSNPLELLAAGGILTGTLTAARLLLGRWSSTQRALINRLAERLGSIVRETSPLGTHETTDTTLALPLEEPEELDEMTKPRARDLA
jgi:hypothetical protein